MLQMQSAVLALIRTVYAGADPDTLQLLRFQRRGKLIDLQSSSDTVEQVVFGESDIEKS